MDRRINRRNRQIIISALLLIALVNVTFAESSRKAQVPARVLAKQTGATQFEEERIEPDCNEHKHQLKKRASDEDVDYEVYQGVVGRPGVDFPIYPRIPRTSFSCKSYGNGYFADMETDCQVFHICEEGRKISFLCPNGTIFQQSELICDWWFKVNCLGSAGFYAESAELLSKQRHHRLRPSVPVQGFNIVGGGLNIKPNIPNGSQSQRSRHSNGRNKPERRIDSSEVPSMENVDFDDLSGEKQAKGQPRKVISNIENNSNDETQIAEESASFVGRNRQGNYNYDRPNSQKDRFDSAKRNGDRQREKERERDRSGNGYNNESTERARGGHRGQQRYREDRKPYAESFEAGSSEEAKDAKKSSGVRPVEGFGRSNSNAAIIAAAEPSSSGGSGPQLTAAVEKLQNTTPFYGAGTYTTARRLENTKTTPFYTPTVPTVKSKTTDGKLFYVKGKGQGSESVSATTPNPNRLGGSGGSSLVLESSTNPKTPSYASSSTTFRPFVIGMRHNYDDKPETHRITLNSNSQFNVDVPTRKLSKKSETLEYLPTTTANPPSTGPTYLPKSASAPKGIADAAGDSFLFAPVAGDDESVSRNVNEMLKTINMIKDKIDDTQYQGKSREGLEIPPSSGPDALVSLAKYFATEQAQSPNALTSDKSSKSKTPASTTTTRLSANGPQMVESSTNAPVTNISSEADNIKASLLSEKTVSKYSNLFGLENAKGRQRNADANASRLVSNSSGTGSEEKPTISPFPQIGSTDATISQLAEKPESRKIAQVFSNALTNYLDDPKTFREQLASARPTEPPVGGRANFDVVTVSDFELFNGGTAASYLPTKPTPTAANDKVGTTQNSIAAEINSRFEFSTQLPGDLASTTEVFDTTTYRPKALSSLEKKLRSELSDELLPPPTGGDSAEGEEFLQREQTQSFVKSRNELNTNAGGKKEPKGSDAYTLKPTENPWSHRITSDFLDPLTINDGLMKEPKTTTPSPFTYLPKETTTSLPTITPHARMQAAPTKNRRLVGSAEVTTRRSSANSQETNSWHDILSRYDLPVDTLPSTSGLQRIANKLFGGLNETEALHLKNVMQQAEHNRQVLSLLLLLIQTCDDQNGRALERSRKHLLNALIDMDGKLSEHENRGKTTHAKSAAATAATTVSPGLGFTATTTTTSATTDSPTFTTTFRASTLTPDSGEATTKFEIRVEEFDDDYLATTIAPAIAANPSSNSDKRALELLKSLYSLASKFTSRR